MRRTTARTSTTVTYSATELDQIIDACEERYRPALLLAAYAFLRSGEVAHHDAMTIGLGGASVRVDEATKTPPGGGGESCSVFPSPIPATAPCR